MEKVLLVIVSALFAILSVPLDARASEKKPDEPVCFKNAEAAGRPHRIESIAQISAVQAWIEQIKRQGEAYAMWHNAKSGSIKCKKLERSAFHVCTATGKPCRSMAAVPHQQKKPHKH